MFKRIFKLSTAVVAFALLVAGCAKTDPNPVPMAAKLDIKATVFGADQFNTVLEYSIDDGKTFSAFPPTFTTGQKFKVKLFDNIVPSGDTNPIGSLSKTVHFLDFDWSASTPQPADPTADVAEFTYAGSKTDILVKVTNSHCATDLSVYTGAWSGDQGTVETDSAGLKFATSTGASTVDDIGMGADPTDPNKIWLYDVLGNGFTEKVAMTFNTSASAYDQTITVPVQTTKGGYTVFGSGSYDQCRKTATLSLTAAYIDSVSYADTTRVTTRKGDVTTITITKVTPIKVPFAFKWTYSFTKKAVQPTYCAYSASSWLGAWTGHISYPEDDANTITVDPSNPNKFWMDNFWGDHVSAYIILTPSTNIFDQILTMPTQTTSEGGVGFGSGTYDQCAGKFTFNATYNIGGTVYKWTYNFHR